MEFMKEGVYGVRREVIFENGYRVVNIQNLADKNPNHEANDPDKSHIVKLLQRDLEKKREQYSVENVYFEKSTSPAEVHSRHGNGFFEAFYTAYNNHRDVVLSPDDVWNMIMIMMSKHVNDNAEALRIRFVSHSGKMKLTIIDPTASSVEHSLRREREWEDGFFTQMFAKIRENTADGVVDMLKSDFTTTTPFEELFSIAVIMDTFQKYFTYGRMIMLCGINNIRFMGTLDDWTKLQSKTQFLAQYSLASGDKWDVYIQHILVILQKFVDTYQNNVDVEFWNTIFTSNTVRIGSGGQTDTKLTGWFLHFYGIYNKCSIESIPTQHISVPIELENRWTGITKNLTLLGGFTGVHYAGDGAYRPQLSAVLYHFQNEIDPFSANVGRVEDDKGEFEEFPSGLYVVREGKKKINGRNELVYGNVTLQY